MSCNLGACLYCLCGMCDEQGSILGGFRGLAGQVADFICYNGKSLACNACTRSFYGCVQRQNIGLECNVFYCLDNLADLF